jgi:hypothetical protein
MIATISVAYASVVKDTRATRRSTITSFNGRSGSVRACSPRAASDRTMSNLPFAASASAL